MKRLFLFFIFFILGTLSLFSQDNIVMYNGKKVILHSDFTWEYLRSDSKQETSRIIEMDIENKSLINSDNGKYGVYIDDAKWQQTSGMNVQAGIQLKNSDDTAYAMLIYDGLEIPLESMEELMILNANNLDPNSRVISSEKCNVGSLTGQLITYTAESAGLNFIFFSFVTASKKGTIQFTCFTLESAFEGLRDDFIDLISGFQF